MARARPSANRTSKESETICAGSCAAAAVDGTHPSRGERGVHPICSSAGVTITIDLHGSAGVVVQCTKLPFHGFA